MKHFRKKKLPFALTSLLLSLSLLTACGSTPVPSSSAAYSGSQETSAEVAPSVTPTIEGGTPYVTEDYYIFDLADSVERTAVFYTNRYGITLAGDLYVSKDMDQSQTHPALVIGPPYGGVKEQGPGVYANQLAQRGFVVLAFDPSFNGESGGEPRHLSSPEIFSEDFSAGVDFLGSLDYVDREQIGAIGICGSGGFALSAAAMDTRIKAVATAAMYDISGMGVSMDNTMRASMLDGMTAQRWEDFENGTPAYTRNYPADAPLEELPPEITGLNEEWWTFYGLKRGWHPNSGGSFTNTSMLPFTNYSLLGHIDSLSPRPILFITGDIAHSRGISESVYEMAAEPKELYVVPGAMHIDLYDDVEKIPFDKLEEFFLDAFAGSAGTASTADSHSQPAPLVSVQPGAAVENGGSSKEDASSAPEEEQKETSLQILVESDTQQIIFQLNDSPAAKSLYQQLPLTVSVENFSNNEKIFYPPEKLSTKDTPIAEGPAGTLAYYALWGDVAMFYSPCSGSGDLYQLGTAISGVEQIEQLSGEIRISQFSKTGG